MDLINDLTKQGFEVLIQLDPVTYSQVIMMCRGAIRAETTVSGLLDDMAYRRPVCYALTQLVKEIERLEGENKK